MQVGHGPPGNPSCFNVPRDAWWWCRAQCLDVAHSDDSALLLLREGSQGHLPVGRASQVITHANISPANSSNFMYPGGVGVWNWLPLMAKMLKIECRPSLRWSSKWHSWAHLSPLPAVSLLASYLGCLGCHEASRIPQLLCSHHSHQTARSCLSSDVLMLPRSISVHQVLQPGATCLSEGRWHW